MKVVIYNQYLGNNKIIEIIDYFSSKYPTISLVLFGFPTFNSKFENIEFVSKGCERSLFNEFMRIDAVHLFYFKSKIDLETKVSGLFFEAISNGNLIYAPNYGFTKEAGELFTNNVYLYDFGNDIFTVIDNLIITLGSVVSQDNTKIPQKIPKVNVNNFISAI